MTVVEILPGWIWGPGDAGPTAAGQMALDYLARKIPGLIDGGTCIVDARDVAAAMIETLDKGRHGERYIVAGRYGSLEDVMKGLEKVTGIAAPKIRLPHPVVMTYAWIAETIGRLTGKEVLVSREGVRTMHAKVRLSSEKAVRELGATFRPLEETLRDVVAWYEQNPMSRSA
jgi:dihydroflavonol-4-reductase